MLTTILAILANIRLEDGIFQSLIYSTIGLGMAVLAYKIIDALTPGKISEQIAKENNVALAIVVGSLILGVCIIIAQVIGG